jgi:hypothetical protein
MYRACAGEGASYETPALEAGGGRARSKNRHSAPLGGLKRQLQGRRRRARLRKPDYTDSNGMLNS